MNNLLKVLNEIRLNQGVSYNLNTGELNPTQGFMVSLPGHERVVPYVDEDVLKTYLSDYSKELANQENYFGCWFDGKQFVLDVSRNIADKRNAIFYGIAWKQRSIWDNERRDEIRVGSVTKRLRAI